MSRNRLLPLVLVTASGACAIASAAPPQRPPSEAYTGPTCAAAVTDRFFADEVPRATLRRRSPLTSILVAAILAVVLYVIWLRFESRPSAAPVRVISATSESSGWPRPRWRLSTVGQRLAAIGGRGRATT